jgi:NAD-dependent protein deacetylase/lipoamidase
MLSGRPDPPPAGISTSGPPPPEVSRIAAWLHAGRNNVVFTGAGASTESGLPDFRSKDGLWARVDPARVASLTAFRQDPKQFYAFYQARLQAMAGALPNPAHRAIARLEALGAVHLVVTQNVDGLHQLAGSREVVEVHGNLREARCAACETLSPIAEMCATLRTGTLPRCARCGGLLRPNVVLFGELLPASAYERAEIACRRCDVLMVVGSSLQVYPAAGLPRLAVAYGARLVIVNHQPAAYDQRADAVLRIDAGRALPQIAVAVEAAGCA